MKKIFILLSSALILSSCVGDSYYDKLNSTPEMSLSKETDTLKVSPNSYKSSSELTVSASDYNMNMRTLKVVSSNDKLKLYDDNSSLISSNLEIGNNVETFGKKIIFSASAAGDYSVEFTVKDAFGQSYSKTANIHAFYNLLPVAVVKSCTLSGTTLSIDLTGSYDQDAKYGGEVSSYIVYLAGEPALEFTSSSFDVFVSKSNISNVQSNLYVAVRDNDGEISSKTKVTIK
jgi:hypothetical protein